MKNKIFYIIITIVALVSLWLIVEERINDTSNGKSADSQQLSELKIGEKIIFVEVVRTEKERGEGLSERKSLAEDSGMLFVFDQLDFYSFWMKGMNFPIDIVWLDENLKIIDFSLSVEPKTYPKSFLPREPALYALEINAGLVGKYGLKIGDLIQIKL
jgi:uncharacterized membrane protein (UPF0127 family)